MHGSLATIPNRLSESDYERERERIRQTYGANKQQAGARFEQELARLFYRSGWTQEQLAKKEGVGQQFISRRLLFGLFLEFTPMGVNQENAPFSKLTERAFRSYWERTHRQAMRTYFDRSRTVTANWRARELAALQSITNRRRDPNSYMRFVFVGMAHEARQKARAAGWRLP